MREKCNDITYMYILEPDIRKKCVKRFMVRFKEFYNGPRALDEFMNLRSELVTVLVGMYPNVAPEEIEGAAYDIAGCAYQIMDKKEKDV